MRVLCLGGAGFIGCALVPKLLEKHEVIVTDWGVFRDGVDFIRSLPHVQYIEQDTRTLDPKEFEGIDAVVDLASISNDPASELDPTLTWQVNRDAKVRNAAIAAAKGVKRYILGSSCSVYGYTTDVATEEHTLFPHSTYAEAVVEAERGVLRACGPAATILRQGTVYGYSPRMRWDLVVNAFVRDIYAEEKITVQGTGEQWRPLVYVHDTAGIMLNIIEADPELVSGQTFNVVGENRQIYELAEDLGEHFGSGVPVEYTLGGNDRRSYRASSEKLTRILNKFCTHRIFTAAEEIRDRLAAGEVRTDLPSTLEVYQKRFGSRLSDLSARVFQT